jgi:hypothetical protein
MRQMRQEAKHGRSVRTLANHYSYLARIPGFIRELWQQRQTVEVIQVAEPKNSAVNYFAVNVEATIRVALEQGAAVILSTPPSALIMRNKPSDPPEKSYWIKDAGTTEEYRRRLAALMQEIAARQRASGKSVSYVSHNLPVEEFLDDAHLTNAGNLTVTRNLIEAAIPFIKAIVPNTRVKEP